MKISASNMHNGNWMFTRQVGPEHPQGGTPCVVIGVRDYEAYEVVKLVDWIADRAAGYPSLKKFEGGANWPTMAERCAAYDENPWNYPHITKP